MDAQVLRTSDCNIRDVLFVDLNKIGVTPLMIKSKNHTNDTKSDNLSEDKPKILIVDDDIVNQKIVSIWLSKSLYNFGIASNGRECIEKFLENNYDFIFMDCQMPEMDGYEATRTIRQIEQELNSRTKIIAMTANVFVGEREKCLECGMDEYISKPLDFKLLTEKCNGMCNQEK